MRPVAAFTRARPIMSPWCLALLGTRLEQRRLGEIPQCNPKTNCREAIRGLTVEQHLSHHAAAGGALRQGHGRRAQHRGNAASGPSEAAERSRSVGIVLKLQERHSGARSLDYTCNPARLFPCRGRCNGSMSFVSEVSRSENDDSPGESLSERSPGTGFLMRLIRR